MCAHMHVYICGRQTDSQIRIRQTDRKEDRQTDKKIDRQTDRQTEL